MKYFILIFILCIISYSCNKPCCGIVIADVDLNYIHADGTSALNSLGLDMSLDLELSYLNNSKDIIILNSENFLQVENLKGSKMIHFFIPTQFMKENQLTCFVKLKNLPSDTLAIKFKARDNYLAWENILVNSKDSYSTGEVINLIK